ncbi:MAG: hypothetical protein ACHQQR_06585 [Gemmatimonadales bacterium]
MKNVFIDSRFAVFAAAILLAALSGARAGAQQEARITSIRDDATRGVVIEQLGLARQRGIPLEPLLSKALEGVAKQASSSTIRAAMDALQKRLRRANDLLAPSPTVDELSAGADALYVGVPDKTLKLMRQAAPQRSIAVELGVLTELVARQVPPKKASKVILDLMARGATGAQLTALNNAVQNDVAAGLTPEAALDRHGRGIMSLLPPPPAVSTLNGRPR